MTYEFLLNLILDSSSNMLLDEKQIEKSLKTILSDRKSLRMVFRFQILTLNIILSIIEYIQYGEKEGGYLRILISNKSDLPIYEQLKIQIKEHIMSGELSENEFLPSIRQLAKDLGISVITTTRAYSDLENEGYIRTMQGKGSFVLPKDNEMIREQYLKRIEDAFTSAIDYGKLSNISNEELIMILENLMKE